MVGPDAGIDYGNYYTCALGDLLGRAYVEDC